MSAFSGSLRWFGMLLVDTANGLERPAPEPPAAPEDRGVEVEEELRRMRNRIQGRSCY